MKPWLQLMFFLCVFLIWHTEAEFFTSIGQMTDLIYAEKDLMQSLQEYIQAEEKKLSQIKSWAEKMDVLTSKSASDPEGYLAHPVNAYKLVKRLNTDWLELENLVLQDTTSGFIANLTMQRQFFPTEEDETGAAKALMRLQDTYKLDPETLSRGNLPDSTHERAGSNLRYFEKLMEKEREEKEKKSVNKTVTTTETVVQSGAYERPLDYLPERDIYEALCRGEGVKMTPRRQKRLFCRYHDGNRNPHLLIAPFKEEDEWDSPHIVRYYDVMSDDEIEKIKQLAKPRLARATVRDPKTGVLTVASYRVSKSSWLEENDDPVVAKVNQRMQQITGLTVKTAELLQVANYGMGGQYEPHFDFSRKDEPDAFKRLGTGNRVATFLNYMSDVEAGGATVFPDFGAAIWPKKGTAVFWYNLLKSGEGDYRTRHAACPVLVGCKWVSNKWFHERGNEFLRPCGRTEVD
ncbi:PREDICTED: prolyl 4-hydroxylase subunit alpha-2 isoform X4 [Sturnus vulgaris]|uniref:prolyl 4-hydroxylase subunit alpha-2 isoform X4 n=1 Tax=Sturnus vulgaris TaxID=9172 RepID=UPI00071A2BB9|nr:PREDICTED: prolyl 4-hydroxylase subunit alpha-2 isoform X4 [Sturnus vulgaris]